MFDGYLNAQLSGQLLNIHYPKLTVTHGFEYNFSLFFNYFSKIPILNQMITDHKEI